MSRCHICLKSSVWLSMTQYKDNYDNSLGCLCHWIFKGAHRRSFRCSIWVNLDEKVWTLLLSHDSVADASRQIHGTERPRSDRKWDLKHIRGKWDAQNVLKCDLKLEHYFSMIWDSEGGVGSQDGVPPVEEDLWAKQKFCELWQQRRKKQLWQKWNLKEIEDVSFQSSVIQRSNDSCTDQNLRTLRLSMSNIEMKWNGELLHHTALSRPVASVALTRDASWRIAGLTVPCAML